MRRIRDAPYGIRLTAFAAALGGQADAIVSGDRDLLVLERFGDIPIIDASQGVGLVEQSLRFG
jgi:predicted nucleic acid-binding protein